MSTQDPCVPGVAEYALAFQAVGVTDEQRALLRCHHAAPARVSTATALATASGIAGYQRVNLAYGALAKALREALGLPSEDHVELGVLVDFVPPGSIANEHWLWVLRPNVAEALEALGWVPHESHLLYPRESAT